MEQNQKNNLPEIKTSLPGPKSKTLIEEYIKIFGDARIPTTSMIKAYGCMKEDLDGNRFLNLSESLFSLGYSHHKILNHSINQMSIMPARDLASSPYINCAKKLLNKLKGELGKGRVNYCTSGTEAVELAIHLAREYTKRPIILSYHDSHHGFVGIPFELSCDPRIKKSWSAKISNIIHIPYPTCYRCPFKNNYPECDLLCLEYIENIFEIVVFPNQVSGLIIEPIIVNGGFYVPPDDYMYRLTKICKKNEIQLIIDEVFTGFGKTGKFFTMEYWDLIPDILCVGKAMGGGLPISSVVTKREISDKTRGGGRVSGSFAANPVACATSIATMDYMEENHIVENADKMGNYLIKSFREMSERKKTIGDVRGKGLLIGIDLVKNKKTKEPNSEEAQNIVRKALNKGIIIGLAGRYRNVLRFTPPLILNLEQVEKIIETFEFLIN